MKLRVRTIAAATAIAIICLGCSRAGTGSTALAGSAAATAGTATTSGNFGTLKDVCRPGNAAGSPDQGVTAAQIKVGVLTDESYTKNPDVVNAAKVFTAWCNAAGGIDGRKLVADVHDTGLFNVVSAMTSACGSDFTLAGDAVALDGLSVNQRLKCLLPEFAAEVFMPQNVNSGLQVTPVTDGHSYALYAGYYNWLLNQAYPGSGSSVTLIYADAAVAQIDSSMDVETLKADGAVSVHQESYPAVGAINWTPYAEAIKNEGAKGLLFLGEPQSLAALETALDNIGYTPDWIDANTNSYSTAFIQATGKSLSLQHNYAALPAIYPVEKDADNTATRQVVSLFAKYAPGQPVTLQVLEAFSAWLIFATAAETCGSDLTRSCVYEAAIKQTSWTGGGLTAPVNLAQPDTAPDCFNVEQATVTGWQPASFGANSGAYRCGEQAITLKGDYPQPITLNDVGKSISDLK